ncbi:ABC transporter ATP-binding protein [Bacillus sp. DNRA2]|uniref:ATP-binding cassette domain-containing protein n=1 Tax=Bacillus sp. DNRA2 TaxID=2723053 RepID=UPI00145F49AF|nr:ABC transporter ATP-binding protein [Bacillus sp. DNRA2]
MLEIKDLQFNYEKDQDLLRNISFTANNGDIIWLKGSNGSGKSTLLRIIAQLIDTEIEIYLDGKLIINREELLSNLIYIPSEPYLFDYLTGEENAKFIQQLFNISHEDFNGFFFKMIEKFNMETALKQPVQEYSLGMRHKLYWSAFFARKSSSIILLDEPFSSLDSDAQKIAKNILIDHAKKGSIIIFVSHLPEICKQIATRCFLLEHGKIKETELSAIQ